MPETFLVSTDQTADLTKMVRVSLETIRNMLEGGADGEETKPHIEQLESLEQLLLDQEARLDAINKVLEEFNYSIAHELCAPLRRISGFTREIRERLSQGLDQEGVEVLNSILILSQQMEDLIEALMQVSRLSHVELQVETVDMSAIAGAIADELVLTIPECRAVFAIQPDVNAKGDPFLLKIALRQLIENAWKFTPAKDTALIEFGHSQREDKEVFFLRDNGVGFDMENCDRLFHPFQRLHETGIYPGSGIGLTVVKKIIERHGGQIWAEGAKNKGATFYFTL